MGRWRGYGNLGAGIYITCNWQIAREFGSTLLRVGLKDGTKILNTAPPADPRVIEYLCREFSRDILIKASWKVIPKNKKLKLSEMINLFRYHYWNTWERCYDRDTKSSLKWIAGWEQHFKMLMNFRSLLIRYGFHGYGNPDDDNGIVIFADDRLELKETITRFPRQDGSTQSPY